MKKLLFTLALATASSVGVFAQGNVNLSSTANSTGTGGSVFISVSTNADGSGAVRAGTAANSAGIVGAGGGQINVSIYIAADGTSLAALEASTPVVIVADSASGLASAQGTFNAGSPFNIANYSSGNVEIIAFATTANGKYTGWSAEATGITPVTGANPNYPIVFSNAGGSSVIPNFTLLPVPVAPEPTTLALGGIGAATLLLFRRKK